MQFSEVSLCTKVGTILKPLFLQKQNHSCVGYPTRPKISLNIVIDMPNMNSTLAYPTRTKPHRLGCGLASGCWGSSWVSGGDVGSLVNHVGSARVFIYQHNQHAGIGNAKWSRWGSRLMRGPNINGFTFLWNIGLSYITVNVKIIILNMFLYSFHGYGYSFSVFLMSISAFY